MFIHLAKSYFMLGHAGLTNLIIILFHFNILGYILCSEDFVNYELEQKSKMCNKQTDLLIWFAFRCHKNYKFQVYMLMIIIEI